MSALETAGLALLRRVEPERAHAIALMALRAGLGPSGGPITGPALGTCLAGLALPNPVGIAAGFDKDAEAVRPLLAAGPGFVEVGAVTPRPQPGNPRPRLFRLATERAAINRFGFNSAGMEAVRPRLLAARGAGVVGVNLGANKDSADRAADYAAVLEHLTGAADFFTVNVSSPNTERLRDLQGRAALAGVLEAVLERRAATGCTAPVFLKVSPDLSDAELCDIAEVATAAPVDAIVATNTTLSREGVGGPLAAEAGGLSGVPLRQRSTRVLARLRSLTDGRMPLIGVGGISTAEDAYARIRAGATAVQLYTAMVYHGVTLPGRIAAGLSRLLAADGFTSVGEAVGRDAGP